MSLCPCVLVSLHEFNLYTCEERETYNCGNINSMSSIRRSILPAYPTADEFQQTQLLLANVPGTNMCFYLFTVSFLSLKYVACRLTAEQLDQRYRFGFRGKTQRTMTTDDERRLAYLSCLWNVSYDVLQYNFLRLRKLSNNLAMERMHRFSASYTDAYLHEDDYSMALEFYLQIDFHLFYMKTCSYRGALPLSIDRGLFSAGDPHARHSLSRCQRNACCLCFPQYQLTHRQDKRVVAFGPEQEHYFVNGFHSILNCPATCTTRNIIYVLTCPCNQVDYIGETSLSLASRLSCKLKSMFSSASSSLCSDHQEHGNRIIHECLLGQKNIRRIRPEFKSNEY